MKVSELFQRLSYGELSNLAIGEDGVGAIPDASKPKIIAYLNDALLRLHSRFILAEREVLIEQVDGVRLYRLSSRYAQSNPAPEPGIDLYIQDEGNPFRDDVIKILTVQDQTGAFLSLNDAEDPLSVFTPQPDVLQIPNPIGGEPLGITYQAQHVPVVNNPDAFIDIPRTLEAALLAYIAHLTFHHMNGESHSSKAAEHLSTYEGICAEIEQKDLVSSSYSLTNAKFGMRGFV